MRCFSYDYVIDWILSCQLSGYDQSDTFKISGTITDSSTGEQVSFASVHVCDTPIWVHYESYSVFCCHIPFLGSTWEDLTVRDRPGTR